MEEKNKCTLVFGHAVSTLTGPVVGTESPGSCSLFIYFRPAKNTKFCGGSPVTCYVPTRWLRCPLVLADAFIVFVIVCYHPLLHLRPAATTCKMPNEIHFGLINSSTVYAAVQPMTVTSMITLSTVYQLGLFPLFDR